MSNSVIGLPRGSKQTDSRPQDNPLGSGLGLNPHLQRLFLVDGHGQRVGWFPHTPDYTGTDKYCKVIAETLH